MLMDLIRSSTEFEQRQANSQISLRVIVDSEPRHERAFLAVTRELGCSDDPGVRFADYVGRSDRELWGEFIARRQSSETIENLLARKRRHLLQLIEKEQPIFAGVGQLVQRLASRYALALASGSERPIVEAVLALDGLARFFRVVVTDSEVSRGKPAPDIFLQTAQLLGVRPGDCWVIEDSKAGTAAGLAAGMRVIAITNTYQAEELREATHVVRSYEDIERLLMGSAEVYRDE
jgi:HAD superfamily hydrolase (TIGR01509 family)